MQRRLQLKQDEPRPAKDSAHRLQVHRRQGAVRAGRNDDGILSCAIHPDKRHTRWLPARREHMADVHARRRKAVQNVIGEHVVSHAANHGCGDIRGTQFAHGARLICALAAGNHLETAA